MTLVAANWQTSPGHQQPAPVPGAPAEWQPQTTVSQLFVLLKDSEEYKRVAAGFNSNFVDILSISRHQNRRHWDHYALRRRQMEEDRAQGVGAGANEKQLYHGTSQDTVDKICARGFNRSFSRRAAYGQGVYFAADSGYSCSPCYARPDPQTNVQVVVRARVLIGDPGPANAGSVEPALKPGSSTETYDSATDDPARPSIHVVFRDHTAYAEHVVHFVARHGTHNPGAGNPFGAPAAFGTPAAANPFGAAAAPAAFSFGAAAAPAAFGAAAAANPFGAPASAANPFGAAAAPAAFGAAAAAKPLGAAAAPAAASVAPATPPPPPPPAPEGVTAPVPAAGPVGQLRAAMQERWRVETGQLQRMLEAEVADHPSRAWDLQWQVESMRKQVEKRLGEEMKQILLDRQSSLAGASPWAM
jgi:hypothetical protein